MIWHTAQEKQLIRRFGGTPLKKYGTDGVLPDGTPLEVRCAKRDKRFRIQKDVHETMIRDGGHYIFSAPGRRPVMVAAGHVDKLLNAGPWLKDRTYPHKFLRVFKVPW